MPYAHDTLKVSKAYPRARCSLEKGSTIERVANGRLQTSLKWEARTTCDVRSVSVQRRTGRRNRFHAVVIQSGVGNAIHDSLGGGGGGRMYVAVWRKSFTRRLVESD